MTTDTIKHLGAEFHHAADGVGEALQRLENARADRLAFLRQCSKDSTARLAAIKEEIRTLPEQIAKWDAEAARLESQTAEDLLRQALEPAQEQSQPEPYRAGLPPERLRKVWAEWEDQRGDIVRFSRVDVFEWMTLGGHPNREPTQFSTKEVSGAGMSFRPHGATWARVEAMADERGPYCKGSWAVGNNCKTCWRCMETKPKEAPTLLDLTKLPPGTVCEAVGEIAVPCVFLKLKVGRRFSVVEVMQPPTAEGEDVRVLIGDDTWALPALVPARVVKEGGEQ